MNKLTKRGNFIEVEGESRANSFRISAIKDFCWFKNKVFIFTSEEYTYTFDEETSAKKFYDVLCLFIHEH